MNGFEFVATTFSLQLISCDNQQVGGSSVTTQCRDAINKALPVDWLQLRRIILECKQDCPEMTH